MHKSEHIEKYCYKISIQLKGYDSIRLFQIDDDTLLSELHIAIQDAFELDRIFAYRFYRNQITPSYQWKGFPILPDANSVKNALTKHASIATLNLAVDDILTYIYHPEYHWLFYIKILSKEPYFDLHQEPIFLACSKNETSSSTYTDSQKLLLQQMTPNPLSSADFPFS